jgi:hypothetical protein
MTPLGCWNEPKTGTDQAHPVWRTDIPKAGSATESRPLGMPIFEDKVLQWAVVMVLEAICEQDFLNCSYGFRPGRSSHRVLDAVWRHSMRMGEVGFWIWTFRNFLMRSPTAISATFSNDGFETGCCFD